MKEVGEKKWTSDPKHCPPDSLLSQDDIGLVLLSHELTFREDPEWFKLGRERRFMAEPVRVEKTRRLYTELGVEVRATEIRPKRSVSPPGIASWLPARRI